MDNKKQLLLMISAIEIGIKKGNKKTLKKRIIEFLSMPEMKMGTKKGIFLDNGKPIYIKDLEEMDENDLINCFKEGIKDMKKVINDG